MKNLFISFFVVFCFACSSKRLYNHNYPDCNSNDIEKMDTCLIGMKLKDALNKLKIDSSDFFILDEPPGYFSEIRVSKFDSLKIRIRTKGVLMMDTVNGIIPYPVSKSILYEKEIIDVSWLKPFKNKNGHVGVGVLNWEYVIRH